MSAGAAAARVHAARAAEAGLQRERILLLAWGPAILLQLAHPLVARGVADHSGFRREPWGRARRLHRTVDAMLRLCFGTEDESRAAAARINAIHDRVNGRLSGPAGVFAAGTPYSAHDPALLTWVHATLVAMNLQTYERFVRPLSVEVRDHYCAEASAIEGALGIPIGRLPRSAAALDRYVEAMLGGGEIAVTDTARALARDIIHPPVPLVAAPAFALVRLTTIGLLPAAVREGYGFPWSARHEARLRALTRAVRALLPLVPSTVRIWRAARVAERWPRAAGCPAHALSDRRR